MLASSNERRFTSTLFFYEAIPNRRLLTNDESMSQCQTNNFLRLSYAKRLTMDIVLPYRPDLSTGLMTICREHRHTHLGNVANPGMN